MFDGVLPEPGDLVLLSEAGLVDAARGWAHTENAACARKLAVLAELFARRTGLPAGERELWWVDPEAAVADELAAAVNVSRSMALHQTHRGVALRDRLPRVAALFEAGLIGDLLVRTIVWRTYLIADEDAMAAVDEELAAQVSRWGALSIAKTEAAIDALVDRFDPAALRRSRDRDARTDVEFGSPSDVAGTTSIWARLHAADAALVKQHVLQLAGSVCAADPRRAGERRAAALTALVDGAALGCRCGQPECPGGQSGSPATNAVVYVLAEQHTLDAAAAESERATADKPTVDELAADGPAAERGEPRQCSAPPAFVFGAGIMPAPLLAATLARARIREVRHPGDTAPEPRYRPSRSTAEFVRCRDLTCRFPGCDTPAQFCDLDHTVAYPTGPTHPSNLKCLCRFHHLLKTSWGWRDHQQPDGTVVWTSPHGQTYTTHPGARLLFPRLCRPTAAVITREEFRDESGTGATNRGLMMPRRKQTRTQQRAKDIADQRRRNEPGAAERIAERNKPPPFSPVPKPTAT